MIRCSHCLMPNTLQGSDFDVSNTCSWCRTGFPNYKPKGMESLEAVLKRTRDSKSPADCLVGISGGKDSSYALLELKKTFGMRAEAFTYSHFGLNQFALQNAQTVCEALKVKHHVVSLGNDAHLTSFKRYFRTWFHDPSTTSAGLTCVACKHLHLLGNKLAGERGIPMIFWANCPLEYAPFLAIKRLDNNNHFERSGLIRSGALLVREAVRSRRLMQNVLSDLAVTAFGCLSLSPTSWYIRHKFPKISQMFFYDYYSWNPEIIVKKLTDETGWIKPVDFPDNWHSDCLFEVFKQYMFLKMLGVSYTDSFLSSQIRHGIISREIAWRTLVESKAFYSKALPAALRRAGLEDLEKEIDYSCFAVT